MRTCIELVERARLCRRLAQMTKDKRLASLLRKLAHEFQEAAKRHNGKLPGKPHRSAHDGMLNLPRDEVSEPAGFYRQ